MLPRLVNFREKVTLIMGSGIQFLDFGMDLELRKELPGEFVMQDSNRSLARLEYDPRSDIYYHPSRPGVAIRSRFNMPVDESVKLFEEVWLPVPVLRTRPGGGCAEGPMTWARARLVTMAPGQDPDNLSHRVTLAFDTTVFEDTGDTRYLAPTVQDVQAGASFAFAHRASDIGWFTELPWVEGWIRDLFEEGAETRLRLPQEDISKEIEQLTHHAHYLNLLALIGQNIRLPTVTLLSNAPDDVDKAIDVDMVLDVGNSRTCGILIEKHAKQSQEVPTDKYELELRDLTSPERVYSEPFESRVEFAQAHFGKENWARQSGRPDAFFWPTIARIGREAARLASRRRGTEGSTGISSPKRYLWDDDRFDNGWRLNSAFTHNNDVEPRATGAPYSNLINETGEALYELDEDDRIPVFVPRYSRSSMMTFMLAEVLVQALSQINSAAQRQKMPNSNFPRHLKSINLTVPPAMPKPEREIFAERTRQAVGLVWKAMGWHPEEASVEEQPQLAWPPFPKVLVQWDESTCGQIVYLFTETKMNFAGRPDEFFRAAARRRPGETGKKLTVASIDIGGGTTDLVINDYQLTGEGANVFIEPKQRFRDGFKIAGDDILLQIIQQTIVPSIYNALREHGIRSPDSLLSRLIGADPVDVQEAVLRQQLALQVMYPAGLRVLKEFEQFDPVKGSDVQSMTLAELLSEVEPPTDKVCNYFERGVRDELQGISEVPFDLLQVPVTIDLGSVFNLFISSKLEICGPLRALCEVVYLYDCDVLLLTGRPSRLPGIQSFFRALLPLPPDRIIKLHEYRTQNWYPFHKQGRIDDPKTTAAVGAMLCVLGQGRLKNFFFRADLLKPYSTVRYLGYLDQDGIIKDSEVFYRDVDLDNEDYVLPDTQFEMHGIMHLGYRQVNAERWGASPIYLLEFADEETRDRLFGNILRVRLEKERGKGSERFRVAEVQTADGRSLSPSTLRLRLNTLSNIGMNGGSYWLDSGSVFGE